MTASAQGLDVSNFQGQFDWAAAKARIPGLAFGIYKLTQGLTFTDPDAQHNHDAIKDQGLEHGAYHFLDPKLPGKDQAQFFFAEHTKVGFGPRDMLWLDTEWKGASPVVTSVCAQAFMSELDRLAGHNPRGVYTYITFSTGGWCAGLGRRPLWLAYPSSAAPVPPPEWARWTFWQWGMRNGDDADSFNGTAADLAAWIDSFAPKPPPPPGQPFRHLTEAGQTLADIAAHRGTTADHIIQETITGWQAPDTHSLAALALPAGVPYYTSRP